MKPRANPDPQIYYHSCERMPEVGDDSSALVIGSPPFTFHPDQRTLDKAEYLAALMQIFLEASRVLAPNGALVVVNTDLRDHARYNRGNTKFEGLVWQKHCDIRTAAETAGFRCFDTKIWAKSLRADSYRYTFSYIQFFRKSSLLSRGLINRSQEDFAPDVWLLEGGTKRRDSTGSVFRDAFHPEIVARCIKRFTVAGDLVISPFVGSGTVLSVARLMRRRCIGYEVNRELGNLIRESVSAPGRFPSFLKLTSKYPDNRPASAKPN